MRGVLKIDTMIFFLKKKACSIAPFKNQIDFSLVSITWLKLVGDCDLHCQSVSSVMHYHLVIFIACQLPTKPHTGNFHTKLLSLKDAKYCRAFTSRGSFPACPYFFYRFCKRIFVKYQTQSLWFIGEFDTPCMQCTIKSISKYTPEVGQCSEIN